MSVQRDEWVRRYTARMLERDPQMCEDDLSQMVEDLADREDWRHLPPEDAADRSFDPERWQLA